MRRDRNIDFASTCIWSLVRRVPKADRLPITKEITRMFKEAVLDSVIHGKCGYFSSIDKIPCLKYFMG